MICVDSSVAAKWFFVEESYQEARALYLDSLAASEPIVAPHLLPLEMTNIVRQRMRRAKGPDEPPLSLAEARGALEHFLSLSIDLRLPVGLHLRALEIADTHGLAAAYDAHYVALAEMLGCDLWTADRRLVNTLRDALPFVRWIGDYQPQSVE